MKPAPSAGELIDLLQLGGDGGRAAVDLDDEVGVARREHLRAQPFAGGVQGEGVGDFQRGRQVAGIEDRLHGGGGHGRTPGKSRPASPGPRVWE